MSIGFGFYQQVENEWDAYGNLVDTTQIDYQTGIVSRSTDPNYQGKDLANIFVLYSNLESNGYTGERGRNCGLYDSNRDDIGPKFVLYNTVKRIASGIVYTNFPKFLTTTNYEIYIITQSTSTSKYFKVFNASNFPVKFILVGGGAGARTSASFYGLQKWQPPLTSNFENYPGGISVYGGGGGAGEVSLIDPIVLNLSQFQLNAIIGKGGDLNNYGEETSLTISNTNYSFKAKAGNIATPYTPGIQGAVGGTSGNGYVGGSGFYVRQVFFNYNVFYFYPSGGGAGADGNGFNAKKQNVNSLGYETLGGMGGSSKAIVFEDNTTIYLSRGGNGNGTNGLPGGGSSYSTYGGGGHSSFSDAEFKGQNGVIYVICPKL